MRATAPEEGRTNKGKNRWVQLATNRNGDTEMTMAETVYNAITANPDGNQFEIMEEVSNGKFISHRRMFSVYGIVEFDDRSFFSFYAEVTDEYGNSYFSTRADLMKAIEAHSDVVGMDCLTVKEYSGVIRDRGYCIDTLVLTDIIDASGNRVEFVSNNENDWKQDACYIEYRSDLAAAIGKRMRIMAREGTYEDYEDFHSHARYSFHEPVLLNVTFLEVLPDTQELRTMEEAGSL
jgi:hypothetical protein